MAGQKIRIRLKAYDHEVIDSSAMVPGALGECVMEATSTLWDSCEFERAAQLLDRPHKYKDSREHFEMRTHKRLIDIIDPTPKTVDSLMRLDLPAGVDIEIKL